ncbi:type-1 angiotensin II receptor-associated protein-like [Oppia nitens]|uniref:type-1 angiotensin II receptor-associated protein-like n=1 Tax=Oppia nitens TaxID=1686743 RepID=UPI0023DBB009|nr:type-1 angiotensin II receptor-associated protein-like [Oppia nitens]
MDALQAMNEAPLKAVFLGHFMLISWCLVGSWLPNSFLFYNTFFMICLLWSMHARDNHEPLLLAILINILSIVIDAISIGIYYEPNHAPWFGFSLFMAITNLLLRPITSLVMLRVFNERSGRYSTFGFPGLGSVNPSAANAGSGVFGSTGGIGGGGPGRGSYENIDGQNRVPHQSVPSPIHDVEANNQYK